MSDRDRIDFLQGQVECLTALSFALMETHQDKKRLLSFAEANIAGVFVKLEKESAPKAMLEGVEDMKARLLPFLAKSAARST